MCAEGRSAGHPELWRGATTLPADRGPESNLEMWEEAEAELDLLCSRHEQQGSNGGTYAALVDAYNRCVEERRRAQDLLKLHEEWSKRPIGGVVEPAE